MQPLDHILQELEQDPELKAIKDRLSHIETELKSRTTDETWRLLLDWEAEWAAYVTLCLQRLYPIAYRQGYEAGQVREA